MAGISDNTIKKILLRESYVGVGDVKKAIKYAKSHNTSFLEYLFQERLIDKVVLVQAIAEFFSVEPVTLKKEKIDADILLKIPEVVARNKQVVALNRGRKGIKVGMTNPNDLETKSLIEKKLGERVVFGYIWKDDLYDVLAKYRSGINQEFNDVIDYLKRSDISKDERDEQVVKVVDIILRYGYDNKASDIHIEPYTKNLLLRFRVDGVMHDIAKLPKELLDPILTRIKILAKLRTDEHRAAQDGKMKYKSEDEDIDIRVSILPVTQGEKVVMRLLSAKSRSFGLTDLGLPDRDMTKVKRAITNPHGMVLVTGPTGSGKTTTLYAVLKILNSREVNITTIEDPVEYDMEGVSQIQVNTKTDLTFAKGLRSIVRQDPDIIMVGEIRDDETAGIAVNSALTGHLVLSTLHTNDAATTLPRFLDMDIEPYLVASTVNVIVAQRLVRKVCTNCRVSYKLSKKEAAFLKNEKELVRLLSGQNIKDLNKIHLYRGAGCKICGDSGYSGRIGVFEVLEMNDDVKELVMKRASSSVIKKSARESGMTTMLEDGLNKVFNGVTTIDEVLRVTRD